MQTTLPNTEIQHHPIPQEAFDWYDEYAHGIIDRRTFMTRLGTLTAAGFSMELLLSSFGFDTQKEFEAAWYEYMGSAKFK